MRNTHQGFQSKFASSIKTDSQRFYVYVRSKHDVRDKVGRLRNSSGQMLTDKCLMAQHLKEQFSSLFISEDIDKMLTVDTVLKSGKSEYLRQLIVVIPGIIANQIKGVKLYKSPGIDGIPSTFLARTVDKSVSHHQ